MFEVQLSSKASDFYRKVDKPLARKLARCFEQLERDPRHHPNAIPLAGTLAGSYRYRVGDYRVLYRIGDQQQSVHVVNIAHRSDVYE
jgi:mRNA interferase RelE/StbE